MWVNSECCFQIYCSRHLFKGSTGVWRHVFPSSATSYILMSQNAFTAACWPNNVTEGGSIFLIKVLTTLRHLSTKSKEINPLHFTSKADTCVTYFRSLVQIRWQMSDAMFRLQLRHLSWFYSPVPTQPPEIDACYEICTGRTKLFYVIWKSSRNKNDQYI